MIIQKTKGLIAAPFTPMHPDRSVNLNAMSAMLRLQIAERLPLTLII